MDRITRKGAMGKRGRPVPATARQPPAAALAAIPCASMTWCGAHGRRAARHLGCRAHHCHKAATTS